MSRNNRRMIFPLRVFGSSPVNRICSGLARAPIFFTTCCLSVSTISAPAVIPSFKLTNAVDGLPVDVVGHPDPRRFGDRGVVQREHALIAGLALPDDRRFGAPAGLDVTVQAVIRDVGPPADKPLGVW